MDKYKKFLIELKEKIRNSGRTSVISISEIDALFIKYNINLKELKGGTKK